MKKYISYILLIIEAVAIFALCMNAAKKKAEHWYVQPIIPDGMLLTIADEAAVFDFSIDNPSEKASYVTIPVGSVVEPVWIGGSFVTFVYEETGNRYQLDNEYFIEQDQLKELCKAAEEKTAAERKAIILNGILISSAVTVCSLIVGGFITLLCIKKLKYTTLIVIHTIALIIISILIANSFLFLEH